MDTYANALEPAVANHSFIQGGATPGECLNFFYDDASPPPFKGYVRVTETRKGIPGNININHLGAQTRAAQVDDVTVVFCAREPKTQALLVVGFYPSATVYRAAQFLDPHPDFVGWKDPRRVWRIASETCVPIAMEDRVFEIPAGIGQADIWYGYNECEWDEDQYAQMLAKRQRLETYLTELQAPKSDSTIVEAKVRRKHRQIERRTNVRGVAFQRGLTCEACGFSAKDKDPIWSSAIEVHHLVPFADLEVGEHRVISDKDLAVLCANCHRAIHRTPNPSDIKAFKDTFMAT